MALKRSNILFLFLSVISTLCFAQQQAKLITISGKVTDPEGHDCLYQVVVVNERTSEGTLAAPGGTFSIRALPTDTILFSASSFAVKKVCMHDSVPKTHYTLTVKLDSMHYNLGDVYVYPSKSLNEIDKERSTVGNEQNTDRYSDTHLLSDPIDYLFERFNRMEKSKRKVARLTNEEQKRQVLKEIFHLYIKNDMMNLSDNQFDAFIDYLNFSDSFIKNATDYELLTAIKYKYEAFENANSYYSPPGRHVVSH